MRGILTMLATCTVMLANTETPLPKSTSEEHAGMLKDGWIAGGCLLNFEPLPEEVELAPIEIEQATPEEIASVPANETRVSEGHLSAYFAERPEGFLVDPQGLLTVEEKKDLDAFLDYHAGDSSIDMHIYIFGAEQEIPGDVREEEIVERLYSVGKPAVVIYYYLGAPQRSVMYLSPVLTDAVSAAEQRRALESSVMQAFASVAGVGQLQGFLVQMSIRIYWMERMAEGTAVETMEVIPDGEGVRKFHQKKAIEKIPVALPDWAEIAGIALAAICGGVILLWGFAMWWKSRARFVFPELDVEPRLGGNHAAGIGAVISFSSSAVPPARQRDQVPDYMRRA